MEFNDIHIGMKCGSKKGSGTVTWIDGSTKTVYLADTCNNNNFEVELSPGLFAGQKLIPVDSVGCYVPGGRYFLLS